MSRSLSLYWSIAIPQADFLACVSDLGGTVMDPECLDVSFSSEDCHVWMYWTRRSLAGQFEPPSETTVARLGAQARLGVTLTMSHEQDAAALAIHVAHGFLSRWAGQVECSVYTALGLDDVKRTLSVILGGSVCLAFADEPLISARIEELSGLAIEQAESDLTISIRAELRTRYAEHFDSHQDQIVALLPVGPRHAWLLRRPMTTSLAPMNEAGQLVVDQAARILGQSPVSLFRLIFDRDDTDEDKHQEKFIVQHLLTHHHGAMIGLFDLVLDLDDIAKMLATGQSVLIS